MQAKGLRRVSSAFEGLKIKAFKRSISDSNPVVAHTAVTAQRRSGCWQWGATRRQTRRNTGQDRKFIPTIVGEFTTNCCAAVELQLCRYLGLLS